MPPLRRLNAVLFKRKILICSVLSLLCFMKYPVSFRRLRPFILPIKRNKAIKEVLKHHCRMKLKRVSRLPFFLWYSFVLIVGCSAGVFFLQGNLQIQTKSFSAKRASTQSSFLRYKTFSRATDNNETTEKILKSAEKIFFQLLGVKS